MKKYGEEEVKTIKGRRRRERRKGKRREVRDSGVRFGRTYMECEK